MNTKVIFFVGAGVAFLGIVIMFTVSLAIGASIMCFGGCGSMAVATLLNPKMFGDPNQPNGWYIKFMWLTVVLGFGLIAIAPIVLIVGITLTASE